MLTETMNKMVAKTFRFRPESFNLVLANKGIGRLVMLVMLMHLTKICL